MQDISRRGFLKVARNGIAAAGLVARRPYGPWSPRRRRDQFQGDHADTERSTGLVQ